MPFPVNGKFIQAAEEKLGIHFPLSYLQRMQKNNGGTIYAADDHWELIPFFDDSDTRRLKRTCNDIVRETLKEREMSHFPEGAVCIADNGTGDKLVFIPFEGILQSEVYLWHLHGGELEQIAQDFEELIQPETEDES